MPMSATFDSAASGVLGLVLRILALAVVAVIGVLVFMFAAAAAVVAGLLILGAAIALRFAPGPKRASAGPETLNATRTASGWVVETRFR